MANEIRQFTRVDRTLPSRSGRICRVLCLVSVAACAAESDPVECGAPLTLRIERVVVPANNTSARESARMAVTGAALWRAASISALSAKKTASRSMSASAAVAT